MGRGDHIGELETLVLASLARVGQGGTGTGVCEDLEARTGRSPSVAAVHVTLRRLEDKRLVSSTLGVPSPRGGRPQRHYALTNDGVTVLRDARRVWQAVWADLSLPDPGARP